MDTAFVVTSQHVQGPECNSQHPDKKFLRKQTHQATNMNFWHKISGREMSIEEERHATQEMLLEIVIPYP